ncbi:MAG: LuxR C-terminal-related transcriptional regulator [Vicinamibacterales bacterium]
MSALIDRRSWIWAALAVCVGTSMFLALEWREEPNMSALDLALELLETLPVVVASVGVVLLFQAATRQREEQRVLLRDLEMAKVQGQRWRAEARTLLNGLGEAIESQFERWHLTDAEREVALLLLKGLSLKEIAGIRATSERTIRAQAQALYTKAGVTGRAALSAFFLEDLLAPIAVGLTPVRAPDAPDGAPD